jgi:hypothetical protein
VNDPDHVVSLERIVRVVDQLDPGTVPVRRRGGELLVGEERDRFIVGIRASAHLPRGRGALVSRRPGAEPLNRQPSAANQSWQRRTSTS